MTEKSCKSFDPGGYAEAVLTEFSKAFDYINHVLLIAKLNTYGVDKASQDLLLSYLTKRKQRIKINMSHSEFEKKYFLCSPRIHF